MRAYWLQRHTRSGALDPHTATTRASSDERRPDGTSAAPGLAAFDHFYTRHEQPLYGYLRRLLPSHEIAVEVAQETFFRAWRHFDILSAYERPEAWLYRVATNLAISHLRRRRPQSFSSLLTRAHTDDADEWVGADHIASPLDMEGQTAERDTIERALRALPERQRAALLLAAVQGLATDEVASVLGVTPDNARKILSRARERFRSLYDEAQRPTT
jgi:RNA polymerase sigma-70 factor (ECF subfamily)